MPNTSRLHTPTFRFGDAEQHAFTFADGWVEPSSSPYGVAELRDALPATGLRPSSSFSGSPTPGLNLSRPHTPSFRFGDAEQHAFTFADGWVEPSSSPFGGAELRDTLPATGLRPSSSSSGSPTPGLNFLLSAQDNGEVDTQQNPPAHAEDNFPSVFTFGQDRPVEFSLRLLHNAASRDPSPRPLASGAGGDGSSGRLPAVAGLPLLLTPPSETSEQPRESLALVPTHARSRSRTSDVSILPDLDEGALSSATPYDVGNETAPAHRFFTPEFQATLREGAAIARNTLAEVEMFDELVEGDSGLEKLLDDATELCSFRGSDTKTIAVLGNSGEGGLIHASPSC